LGWPQRGRCRKELRGEGFKTSFLLSIGSKVIHFQGGRSWKKKKKDWVRRPHSSPEDKKRVSFNQVAGSEERGGRIPVRYHLEGKTPRSETKSTKTNVQHRGLEKDCNQKPGSHSRPPLPGINTYFRPDRVGLAPLAGDTNESSGRPNRVQNKKKLRPWRQLGDGKKKKTKKNACSPAGAHNPEGLEDWGASARHPPAGTQKKKKELVMCRKIVRFHSGGEGKTNHPHPNQPRRDPKRGKKKSVPTQGRMGS